MGSHPALLKPEPHRPSVLGAVNPPEDAAEVEDEEAEEVEVDVDVVVVVVVGIEVLVVVVVVVGEGLEVVVVVVVTGLEQPFWQPLAIRQSNSCVKKLV